jgi:hypothetical protein
MSKLKILIGLATALCTIAASAAPASAEFESLNGKSSESLKTTTLKLSEVGECEAGTGKWTITKSIEGEEIPATKGPKLTQAITFTGCKIKTSTKSYETAPLACESQLAEAKEAVTESIEKCTLKGKGEAEGCEIALSGKEQKSVALKNLGENELEINSNIEPVETKPNAACLAKKIETPKTTRMIWIEWQIWIFFFF